MLSEYCLSRSASSAAYRAVNCIVAAALLLSCSPPRVSHCAVFCRSYVNIITNVMHFSLCFGFAADFLIQRDLGIYTAVPWVGMCSLGMALVTPFQGGLGVLSSIFCGKRFATRMREVVVPSWISSRCSSRFPILGKPSFIIRFGPIGACSLHTFRPSHINSCVFLTRPQAPGPGVLPVNGEHFCQHWYRLQLSGLVFKKYLT